MSYVPQAFLGTDGHGLPALSADRQAADRALASSKLPLDKTLAVLDHIREGCGTLSTARLVGVGKNTVTRYLRLAGEHGRKLHDELVAFSPSHPRRAGR